MSYTADEAGIVLHTDLDCAKSSDTYCYGFYLLNWPLKGKMHTS